MVTSEAEAKARVELDGGRYVAKLSNRSRLVFWIESLQKWAIIEARRDGRVDLTYQDQCKAC